MAGRRGNSEGTIKHRVDGRWESRVTLPDGKRKSFYGETRREVEQKLSVARRDVEKGLPIPDERQTVEMYLRSWLDVMKHQVKPNTWCSYEQFVRLHFIPAFGRVGLTRLTPQQIQQFYARKLSDKLSPTTVHHFHEALHRAFNDALRLGLVQRNVFSMVSPPRRVKSQMQTLTEAQVHQFLDRVRGDRFEALYILALSTGMREGELFGLRWEDLNLERASLQLQVSLQLSGSSYVLAEPKTDHSRRRIGLSRHAVEALRHHRVRQNEERLMIGAAWDSSLDLVFPNALGQLQSPYAVVQTQFHRHLKQAGLPRIRFHDLRHTAATLLLQREVNVKVVSEMLGHANISITLSVYAHVTPHMQETAITAMDLIMDGTGA